MDDVVSGASLKETAGGTYTLTPGGAAASQAATQKAPTQKGLRLEEQYGAARAAAQQAVEGFNVSATPRAQRIFDALCKTLPSRWSGVNIVVLDQVQIASPYGPNDIKSLDGDSNALARISRIVATVSGQMKE